MPPEKDDGQQTPQAAPPGPLKEPPLSALQTLLSIDSDRALLLSLMLLLKSEGADEALLLALLYIML